MPKKKLSTSKEKYDYLIKRYYSDIVTGVKTKENLLFERSLHAILELQECEEIYLKDKKTDIDFEYYHITLEDLEKWDGITNESKKEFFQLKINNDQISSADFEWIGESYVKEKEDKDNSEISASPLFDMYVNNKFTNRIILINMKNETHKLLNNIIGIVILISASLFNLFTLAFVNYFKAKFFFLYLQRTLKISEKFPSPINCI
jgi:hypothetical protein